MLILLIKIFLCLTGAALCLLSLRRAWWAGLALPSLLAIGFGWRYVLLLSWFGVMGGNVSGDVSGYDLHTRWVLDGLVPNGDFQTPYGVYLNYFNAALYGIWADPRMLVAAYQALELAGIAGVAVQLARIWGAGPARLFVVLYCFNPIVISWLAFDGQEESLVMPLLALLVWAWHRPAAAAMGLAAAAMVFTVKITTVTLWVPFVALRGRAALAWTAAAGAVLAVPALLLGSWLFSTNFTRDLEAGTGDTLAARIFPGNPWYVAQAVEPGLDPGRWPFVALALLFSVTGAAILRGGLRDASLARTAAMGSAFSLAFQLTSPYTSPGFLAVAVPLLLIAVMGDTGTAKVSRAAAAVSLGWALLAALDMPFYFRFPELRTFALGQVDAAIPGLPFMLWQGLLVLGNATVFALLLRRTARLFPRQGPFGPTH